MTAKQNSSAFLRYSVAIGFSVAAWVPPNGAAAQALGLAKPPELNYKQVCKAAQPPLPLAADWAAWTGADAGVSPDRMLVDAIQLIDGGNVVHRNRPLARKILERLAESPSAEAPEAKRRLALLLLDARAGTPDPERAKTLLTEATAAQRTDAALTLGRLIHEGKLPGFAKEDAARYLGIAVGLGDPVAALELAALYRSADLPAPFEGATTHFETLGAINVLTTLAAGDCSVALDVGDYLADSGKAEAAAHAVAWYEIAANAGDIRALGKLARAYELGQGVKPDPTEALKLWDRAAAAGWVNAMASAARPRLVEAKETAKALALLETGMANDDPESYLLAARQARGDFTAKADFPAMRTILSKATDRPDASIYTLEMAANAALAGQGAPQDLKAADNVYQRILSTGLPEGEALYGRYTIRQALGLEDGARHLKRAAQDGSTTAKFALAELTSCFAQEGVDPSLMMQAAADDGSTAAMRILARRSLQAGQQDKALSYLERARKAGDRLAMVELAALAQQSAGADSKSVRALIEAASADGEGVTAGRLALAQAYRRGRLGEDGGKSDALLASIADSALPEVDVEIAARKLEASPLSPDDLEAVSAKLLRAATAGEPKAMLMLSRILLQARADTAGSAEWLLRAAERGEPSALADMPTDNASVVRVLDGLKDVAACDLPLMMQKARLLRLSGDAAAADNALSFAEKGVEGRPRDQFAMAQGLLTMTPAAQSDVARAERLLVKSAEAGHAKAGLAVAKLYDSGRLGDRPADAIEWYRKVALTGEAAPLRELSRYAALTGTGKTEALALDALRQVAEAKNPAAMRTYGALLTSQRGERYAEGMSFLQQAADLGDAAAMKTIAWHYAAGLNGEVSATESVRWMRMAAEKGDAEAMFRYATALDLGFGVNADPQSAKSWHERAIKNGFVQ